MQNRTSKCDHCRQPVDYQAEMEGQEVECPSCSQKFRLKAERKDYWEQVGDELRGKSQYRPEAESASLMTFAAVIGGLAGITIHNFTHTNTDNWVTWGVAGIILGIIYFVPSLIAQRRKHPQLQALMALNLFGGLIIVGWVAALVWVLFRDKSELKE